MAKKPQTEAKAKGLIANVGDYRGKTLNLSKKQLGKSGRSAAAARTVDISQTRYEGKKVLGPKGKALTGRVDLGGGNIAVYQKGVRVRAQKPQAPTGGGGTPKPSAVTSRVSPSARGEGAGKKYQKPANFSQNRSGPKAFSAPTKEKPTMRYAPPGASPQKIKNINYATRNISGEKRLKGALFLGGVAALPFAGAAAGAVTGVSRIAAVGRVAGQGASEAVKKGAGLSAGTARGSASAAQAAAKKAVTPFKEGVKSVKGTTKGVSKVSGGALKKGKPATYGPKKPTAAQAAASRRKAAAQKAAATRKANAAKAARGRKKP